jgi:hypothetical protein
MRYPAAMPSAPPAADRMRLSVSEIRAAEQQQETDRPQEHPERLAQIVVDQDVGQPVEVDAPVLVGMRIVVRDPRADGVHVGLRLFERHTRLQPRDHAEPVVVARPFAWRECQRTPQLRPAPVERAVGRHDADHGVRIPVEQDRAADDGRIAPELLLPERMADHDDAIASGRVFAGGERPSRCRLGAIDVEVRGRDAGPPDLHWSTGSGECRRRIAGGGRRAEHRVLVLPVAEVHGRGAVAQAARRPLEDADDAGGIAVGQRPEQHAVDEAEDRARGADPEREHQQRDDRERGAVPERAQRVTYVLSHE